MEKFIRLETLVNYDDKEKKQVFVNPRLIVSIERKMDENLFAVKMFNGDFFVVEEFPNALIP